MELFEIFQIYKNFCDETNQDFINRLKKIICGQDLLPDTYTVKHDNSRDFLYELSIASDFKNLGYRMYFNEYADVIGCKNSDVVIAECKRISSKKSFEKNINKAGEQLAKHKNNDSLECISEKEKNIYRFIFIDISRCIEDKIPCHEYYNTEGIEITVRRAINEFLNDSENKEILDCYSEKFVDATLAICLTYRRTLWTGGKDIDAFFYTYKHFHISKTQIQDAENILKNIFQLK